VRRRAQALDVEQHPLAAPISLYDDDLDDGESDHREYDNSDHDHDVITDGEDRGPERR
jgi:hypothetical protein